MSPDEVQRLTGVLPYMKLEDAWFFRDFIQSNQLRNVLELGFYQGMSSAFLAGILDEMPGGQLTTIDLEAARMRLPNIEEVLARANLSKVVKIFYEARSFNWRLMRFLQEGLHGTFDLCYIDGGHNWYESGFAFCLIKHLLAPGGWVVFDDLYFSFSRSQDAQRRQWPRRLPPEEQTEMQVLRIFELLVQNDPEFANFRRLRGRFAFAQKLHRPTWNDSSTLPKEVDIALSLVLERAHADSNFRTHLMSCDAHQLGELLGNESLVIPKITFEESASSAPMPVRKGPDDSWIVPVERVIRPATRR